MLFVAAASRQRRTVCKVSSAKTSLRAVGELVEASNLGSDLTQREEDILEEWNKNFRLVYPEDIRNRLRSTRAYLGRQVMSYVGDAVWEYMVLRHQYNQVVRSPWNDNDLTRLQKQAKAGGLLWRGNFLKPHEKQTLLWAMAGGAWKMQAERDQKVMMQMGFEQYVAANGLRALLCYLYLDAKCSDARLAEIAMEIGFVGGPEEEDALLSEVTGGIYDFSDRPPNTYFLALAPLGYVALRLYICRYFCQRPQVESEFIYRVELALRQEELDLAAGGFMRDDATPEEIKLMRGARDRNDSYAFAFECLLGHLAITSPYRLHQIISNFGWAPMLPGT
jgi:23S rRNA maturation mini-RNase III